MVHISQKMQYMRFRITSLNKDGFFLEVYNQLLPCNHYLKKHLEVLSRSFIPYIHQIRLKINPINNILFGIEIQAKYGFDSDIFKDKIIRKIIKNNISNDSISNYLRELVRHEEVVAYDHALYCIENDVEILTNPIYYHSNGE